MTRENPFFELYAKAPRPEFPLVVDVEATNVCNLKCQMCSRQIMKRAVGNMDWETFSKIADECGKWGAGIRFIRWGEPFINDRLPDFVGYAKECGCPVHITNNGQIINEEKIKLIVEKELDSIIFSFQGANKESYEKMRVGASYDLTEKNIRELIKIRQDKEKPFIQITSTMTDETEEQINAFKNYWGKIVDKVAIGKTYYSRLKKEPPKYRKCKEVLNKLSVDWNGDITACCADYDKMMTIGNIKTMGLAEAFNCSKMKAIRVLLENGCHRSLTLCSTCNYAYEGI